MNVTCPNCQKEIVIADESAGQPVQCPLCDHTFTAPAMPEYPSPQPEPIPVQPVESTPPTAQAPAPEPPRTAPSMEKPAPPTGATAAASNRLIIRLSPNVLQWLPIACLALIFLLYFFTWIWIGYGSTSVFSQNGFQAAFGGVSYDEDLIGKDTVEKRIRTDGPGVSVWTLLYFLPFYIITLLVAIVIIALPFLPMELPPAVQGILPWKWGILAGLLAAGFLLLILQLLLGFSLENQVSRAAYEDYNKMLESSSDAAAQKRAAFFRDMRLESIHRSRWLTFVFWLHLIALVSAGLMFLKDYRPQTPLPEFEVRW